MMMILIIAFFPTPLSVVLSRRLLLLSDPSQPFHEQFVHFFHLERFPVNVLGQTDVVAERRAHRRRRWRVHTRIAAQRRAAVEATSRPLRTHRKRRNAKKKERTKREKPPTADGRGGSVVALCLLHPDFEPFVMLCYSRRSKSARFFSLQKAFSNTQKKEKKKF